MPPKPNTPADFWPKVDTSGECWLWTGTLVSGYGTFWMAGRQFYAHRIAWELTYGPIPNGLWVLHNCPDGDNRRCCNPAHLFLGTHTDNMRDMVGKGRHRAGRAKVTPAQVREMRDRYAAGGVFLRELAAEYGISTSQVFTIVRRQEWRGVS
jgi:hypothetical protein